MRFDFEQIFPGSSKAKPGPTSTIGDSPSAAVALPVISSEVPTELTYKKERSNGAAWELLLLAIAETTEIDGQFVLQALSMSREPREICTDVLKQYMGQLVGACDAFDLKIEFSDAWQSDFAGQSGMSEMICERDGVDYEKPHLMIATVEGANKRQRFLQPVHQRLTSPLEKALYYRAYRALGWFQYRFLIINTPAYSEHLAQRHYWNWEEDEQAYFRSERDYGENDELKGLLEHINSDEMYRYKDLLRSFGALLVGPKSPLKLTDADIRRCTNGAAEAPATQLASVLQAAQNYIKTAGKIKVPSLQEVADEPIGSSLLLRWNNTDDTLKIYDDFYYGTMNAGYNTTECFGVRSLQVSSIEEAHEFIAYLKQMALELSIVDGLIAAISDPDTQ